MIDISKCTNTRCMKKMNCLRYVGKDSKWQSYTSFEVVDGVCNGFVEVVKKRKGDKK